MTSILFIVLFLPLWLYCTKNKRLTELDLNNYADNPKLMNLVEQFQHVKNDNENIRVLSNPIDYSELFLQLSEIDDPRVIDLCFIILNNRPSLSDNMKHKYRLFKNNSDKINALKSLILNWDFTDFSNVSRLKCHAAWVLGIKRSKEGVGILINCIDQPFSHKLNDSSIWALGEIKDKRAVFPLIKLLSTKYSNKKEAAAIALGKIGDKRAVPHLIKMLKSVPHSHSDNIAAAAKALGDIGDTEAVPPLINILKNFPQQENQTTKRFTQRYVLTIEALGKIGDIRALIPIQNILNNTEIYWLKKYSEEAIKKIKANNKK